MNVAERAAQIWPILAFAAGKRMLLTYQEVGDVIGVPAFGLGQCLEPIQTYCVARGIPPLTAIVVSVEDGMPGVGFSAAADVPSAQAGVFRFDWSTQPAPSARALADAQSDA